MTSCLAIDIGGSKILAALVEDGAVIEEQTALTERTGNATDWCDAVADLADRWQGRYQTVGAAVTGLVANGRWTALNPKTLPIEAGFPLTAELHRRFALPVTCVNDAQAAAWGEYRHGAARGEEDLVFLTISTGIGGGVVHNGQLVIGKHGLAGSAGQTRFGLSSAAERVEDLASGLSIASAAKIAGHDIDARSVIAASRKGEAWAEAIVARAAEHIAMLILNLHMLFDPAMFIIGGGIGLADGMLREFESRLSALQPEFRPTLCHAALGKYAGVIGAADLAAEKLNQRGGN